jgi:serine protease SohB
VAGQWIRHAVSSFCSISPLESVLEFLSQYGLFLAQAATIVIAILVVVAGMVALGQRQKQEKDGHIEVRHLNERYRRMGDAIRDAVLDKMSLKIFSKSEKKAQRKAEKDRARAAKKAAGGAASNQDKPRLYTLNFHGDLKASAADSLREEISAVLTQVREGDAVLVRLESAGGMVHSYGLAASQLQRLVDAGVDLTVAVDRIAASGGYMMACVARRIIAAPFAVIGSIGVMAQLPNFNRLLKKHHVDFELLTAGEYKRTLTLFGENTDKGRSKFVEELEHTHALFKSFVSQHRPNLDIDTVATGEIWYGQDALEKNLVDELKTSDAFILEHLDNWEVYEVRFIQRKSWQEKLGVAAENALERGLLRLWQHNRGPHI